MSAAERPILFSGPMVRAILNGSKTQTRRVVTKHTSLVGAYRFEWLDLDNAWADLLWGVTPGLKAPCAHAPEGYDRSCRDRVYPRIHPGDRLWVREAHALVPATAYAMSTDDGVSRIPQRRSPEDSDTAVVYREGWSRCKPGRWRPSIHMPRWASRITLEVTDVRVERVQEITNDDARAEGCPGGPHVEGWSDRNPADPYEEFASLWDEINAARGYGWDENPWVWVVGFRSISRLDGTSPEVTP